MIIFMSEIQGPSLLLWPILITPYLIVGLPLPSVEVESIGPQSGHHLAGLLSLKIFGSSETCARCFVFVLLFNFKLIDYRCD